MLPEIKKILYATDLASNAPTVFRHAMGLAQQCDARIVVLHVVEPPTPYAESYLQMMLPADARETMAGDARARIVEEVHRRLGLFCEQETCQTEDGQDRVSNILVREGRPASTILEEADRTDADLVIMGAHGHSMIGEVLIGSVANQVTQHATIPVMVIRVPKTTPSA